MKLLLVLGFLLSLFLVSCMGSAETEINFIFKGNSSLSPPC